MFFLWLELVSDFPVIISTAFHYIFSLCPVEKGGIEQADGHLAASRSHHSTVIKFAKISKYKNNICTDSIVQVGQQKTIESYDSWSILVCFVALLLCTSA